MKKHLFLLIFVIFSITSIFSLTYTLSLADSYGDGWNGGSIDVLVNDVVVIDDATISSGNSYTETFEVNGLDVITTAYTAGSWGSENSYQILNETGTVVAESGQSGIPSDVEYTVPEVIAGTPDVPTVLGPSNNSQNLALDTTIEWTTGENTELVKLYFSENADLTDAIIVNPATSPYVPTLENNVTYYWKLVAVGPTDIEVETQINNFTTEYGVVELPYNENFDNISFNETPAGWSFINTSTSTYAWINVKDIDPYNGSNHVRMYNSYFTDIDLVATTPKVVFEGNRVRFQAQADDTDVSVVVGYMTDPSNLETFTEITTFNLTAEYASYNVALPSNVTDGYLAFRHGMTANYQTLDIDDVNIEEIPSTPIAQIATDDLDFGSSVLNETSEAQDVTLTNIGGGTLNVSSVTITGTNADQFLVSDNSDYALEANESMVASVSYNPTLAGQHTATLEITDDLDTYQIALTGQGVDTNIYEINIPYTQDFETEEGFLGWTSNINSTSDYASAERYSSSYSANNGTYSFKFYNSSDTDAVCDLVSPVIVPDMDAYRVKFFAKGDGSIVVGKLNTSDEFTFVDSLDLNSTYTEYTVNMEVSRANERLVFRTTFDSSSDYVYLDDVLFEEAPEGSLVTISPDSHDFESKMINSESAPITFTISNDGVIASEITEISINGEGFVLSHEIESFSYILEPNTSIDVQVAFAPEAIMDYNAQLVVKEATSNPFVPNVYTSDLTGQGLDNQGNDHSNPFVMTLADTIVVTGNTEDFENTYSWATSPSVVYSITLEETQLMSVSLEGTSWDTKLWIFNSTEQIESATVGADAWYFNDDEGSASTGGRKDRTRATWSKMNDTFTPAGTYYIVVTGYNSNSGEYTCTVVTSEVPAPQYTTNPTPADSLTGVPTAQLLSWTNPEYTETIDLWFGTEGNMNLVLDNVDAVEEYQPTELTSNTTYQWKVIARNFNGQTPADSVATWSFTTIGQAPDPVAYTSPADASVDTDLTVTLNWNSSASADEYKVYFATSEDLSAVTPVVQTETSYEVSDLDYATTYYWMVVPSNIIGDAEGAETWSFTTMESPFPAADLVFDGERSTNQNMPIEPFYGYTLTQNIYLQSELNIENHAISEISYLYNNNSAWTDNVIIYMGHTSKTEFESTTDWINTDLTEVFNGDFTTTTDNPVVNISLSTPFVYNNSDNLIVCVFENSSGYHASNDEFYNFSVDSNRSLNYKNDSTNPYTLGFDALPTGTLKPYLPVTGFNFQEVSAEPQFTASSDTLFFVDQIMNTVSGIQNLVISNLGLGDLTINSVALAGANAVEFDLTDENAYPATLATSEILTVSLVYSPETAGDHLATIEIVDGDNTSHIVELVGNSIDTNIYETDLPYSNGFEEETSLLGWTSVVESTSDYASLELTTSSSYIHSGSKAMKLYNSGDIDANLSLTSPIIVPDFDGYRLKFWARSNSTSRLVISTIDQAMENTTLIDTIDVTSTYTEFLYDFPIVRANTRLVFTPVFTSTYNSVYLDDISFTATPLVAIAEVSENQLAFGDVPVEDTSSSQTVTITNIGASILNVNNIEIIGDDAEMFSFSTEEEASTALASQENLEISVTFIPSSEGEKTATLVITDDLTRTAHNVTLTGNGWVIPAGTDCSDPLALTLPAVDVTGNTGDYGDDYSSNMISPSSSYLNGDDVVYQFTVDTDVTLDGTITTTGSWMGAFILADEPNATTPAAVEIQKTTSGTSLTYSAEALPAGTYFLIISTYPTPQAIDYTINLTATPVVTQPDTPVDFVIESSEAGMVLTWNEVEGATTYKIYACATPDGTYEMMTGGQVETVTFTYTEDAPMMFFKVYASTDEMPAKTIRRARRN